MHVKQMHNIYMHWHKTFSCDVIIKQRPTVGTNMSVSAEIMTMTEPSASPSTCKNTALMFICSPDDTVVTVSCSNKYKSE